MATMNNSVELILGYFLECLMSACAAMSWTMFAIFIPCATLLGITLAPLLLDGHCLTPPSHSHLSLLPHTLLPQNYNPARRYQVYLQTSWAIS